jgi:hypothetical protein
MPLPARSRKREISGRTQPLTPIRIGRATVVSAYPTAVMRFRFRILSLYQPANIFRNDEVESATPSMIPMTEYPTPSVPAKKSGRARTTISPDTSLKKLASDTQMTLRGSFSFSCVVLNVVFQPQNQKEHSTCTFF